MDPIVERMERILEILDECSLLAKSIDQKVSERIKRAASGEAARMATRMWT